MHNRIMDICINETRINGKIERKFQPCCIHRTGAGKILQRKIQFGKFWSYIDKKDTDFATPAYYLKCVL